MAGSPTGGSNLCRFRCAELECDGTIGRKFQRFANGKTNVSVITTEISDDAFHLLVTSPPMDANGSPTCQIISDITNDGFKKILMPLLEAHYDPAKGLSFDVPVQPLGEDSKTVRLLIDLNQSNGKLDALFSGF
ncbi:MAG: hypothetical protein AAF429_05500 [Pseudomonadota bacterium]